MTKNASKPKTDPTMDFAKAVAGDIENMVTHAKAAFGNSVEPSIVLHMFDLSPVDPSEEEMIEFVERVSIAHATAQSIFGETVKPEIVLDMYERLFPEDDEEDEDDED